MGRAFQTGEQRRQRPSGWTQCGKVRVNGPHSCCAGQLPGPESKGKPGAGVRATRGQDQTCVLQRAPWVPGEKGQGAGMEAGSVKSLLQCPGKRGWWPSLGCYLWRQGEVGERSGLRLQAAPAGLETESSQGPPSPGPGGCHTAHQPKAERTKPRGDFPLPALSLGQAGAGRVGGCRCQWQDGNPGSSSLDKEPRKCSQGPSGPS